MRAVIKAVWQVAPPFVAALLYVDLFTSPFVCRMGISSVGEKEPGGLPPGEAKKLEDLADGHFRKGEYQLALALELKLYRSYPENPVYLKRLAEIYGRAGRYEDEAGMWEQFVLHAPVPVEGCPQLGQTYEKLGKRKEAINAFERCLSFDSTDPDGIFFLAHALEIGQQFDRAQKLYRQCIDIAPRYTDCRVGLGRALFRTGHRAEAKKIAEEVLKRSPDNTDAMLVLGLVDWSEGNLAAARRVLEQAIKISDRYADLYLVLGRVAARQGDRDLAKASYARVLELDPDNKELAHRAPTAAPGNAGAVAHP